MTDTDLPAHRPDVFLRPIGEEALLYEPASGSLHVLNATAGIVWTLCDGGHTRQDIEAHLRAATDAPPDADVAGDVQEILLAFAELGVLT